MVAPYDWMLGVDGDVNIGRVEAEIDQDFGDLLDKINFVVEGRFEAWKGKWGITLDLTYAQTEVDATIAGRVDVTTKSDLLLGAAAVSRNLIARPLRANGSGLLQFDGSAGVLVTSVDTEIERHNAPDAESSFEIFDPFVGARALLHWTTRTCFGSRVC